MARLPRASLWPPMPMRSLTSLRILAFLPLVRAGDLVFAGRDGAPAARVTATCSPADVAVVYLDPPELSVEWSWALGRWTLPTGQTVRAALRNAPAECLGPLSQPCASSDSAYPALFHCKYTGQRGSSVVGRVRANATKGRSDSWLVSVTCPAPNGTQLAALLPEGATTGQSISAVHTLTLTLSHGRESDSQVGVRDLPFEGLERGNEVDIAFPPPPPTCGPEFKDCVASYYSPGFANYDSGTNWPARIWVDACAYGNARLGTGSEGSPWLLHSGNGESCSADCNAESINFITMRMRYPTSANSFSGKTRQDFDGSHASVDAGHYFGNAKLYGCNGGSSDDGSGCSWVELAHIAEMDSKADACQMVGPASVSDTTLYSYFRMTMFGNNRGAHEAAAYLAVNLRPFPSDSTPPPTPPPAPQPPRPPRPPRPPPPSPPPTCGPEFKDCVASYYSPGFANYDSGTNWPARIWVDACAYGNARLGTGSEGSPWLLHSGNGESCSADCNAESINFITMRMRYPTSANSFSGKTRQDFDGSHASVDAGHYFGNAKLYGCNGGSSDDGSGCSWVELAHIAEMDSKADACQMVGPASVSDTTLYSYFRMTMFGNNRGAHEAAAYLAVGLRGS